VTHPSATDTGCRNLRWAFALLDGLAAAGLRTLVMSPGSRSTPVVLAAERMEAAGVLELVPILDERSAAFFALGLARGSGRPVALLATSGSAPAHWYPAVIEADAAGLPLVLLSADRPPRLRGWGANQTIDQTRLFGPYVREFHDPGLPADDRASLKAIRSLGLRAASVSLAPAPGPVHLNLPFDEPLVPAGDCAEADTPMPPAARIGVRGSPPIASGIGPSVPATITGWPRGRGLLVCGPGIVSAQLNERLWRCAGALALPVLADPLSGLRAGPAPDQRITGYDALLRNAAADRLRPDWLLRIGRAPVSKTLSQWLTGLPTLLIDSGGGWSDPSHDVVERLIAEPTAVLDWLVEAGPIDPDQSWLDAWIIGDRAVRTLADRHLAESHWCEGHLIRALVARMADGESLFCANSLPIRQLDTWSGPIEARIAIVGNRGTSGIDGQLSTLAGLNAAGHRCWGLLGDLSFCHDLSGLLLADRLKRPVVVINNGGGRIFDYLPQRGLPGLERLWRTPVAPDLAALAQAFGLRHRRAEDAESLVRALDDADAADGATGIVEVMIDADASRTMHLEFWRNVADARSLTSAVK